MNAEQNTGGVRTAGMEALWALMLPQLSRGGTVQLTVSGNSMYPMLRSRRDTVVLRKDENLRKGDLIFFRREDGSFVLHRIIRVNSDGSLIMLGDAQVDREWIEGSAAVRGIVVKVLHRGKVLTRSSFRWWFFEKIWPCVVPLRPAIMTGWKIIARK